MLLEKEINTPTPLTQIHSPLFTEKGIEVWIKEDYLTHPAVSGNKYRKLKYNLIKAKNEGFSELVTFGGAYSNHIYALAAAGKLAGFKTRGIIRGDELHAQSSPTLTFAHNQGMKFHFVSRSAYRNKEELTEKYASGAYLIPEGGSNLLALPGCSEIVDEILPIVVPSDIILAAGTGGTAAGILTNENFHGNTHVIPVLKNGGFIAEEITILTGTTHPKLKLHTDYHFGGYAKGKDKISLFIESFEQEFKIPIEHVYTAKLFFGLIDLIQKDYFSRGATIVAYHSGGLQNHNLAF